MALKMCNPKSLAQFLYREFSKCLRGHSNRHAGFLQCTVTDTNRKKDNVQHVLHRQGCVWAVFSKEREWAEDGCFHHKPPLAKRFAWYFRRAPACNEGLFWKTNRSFRNETSLSLSSKHCWHCILNERDFFFFGTTFPSLPQDLETTRRDGRLLPPGPLCAVWEEAVVDPWKMGKNLLFDWDRKDNFFTTRQNHSFRRMLTRTSSSRAGFNWGPGRQSAINVCRSSPCLFCWRPIVLPFHVLLKNILHGGDTIFPEFSLGCRTG